ncbi:hypothetical protein BDA99DRAFT_505417 [Phascolomyces articulosus]|uniref:Uncharacterized protein n=1 Tax=Phascolomyces articulosus TaxID=60185 RepID=A0AAD5K439_9FUNG|nr:hypothetical protein BDA99DRAFT_505417 [Phascolomyces articulosus]
MVLKLSLIQENKESFLCFEEVVIGKNKKSSVTERIDIMFIYNKEPVIRLGPKKQL